MISHAMTMSVTIEVVLKLLFQRRNDAGDGGDDDFAPFRGGSSLHRLEWVSSSPAV
jgi:hypothetical protein